MRRKEKGRSVPSLPKMFLRRLWGEPPPDDKDDKRYLEYVRATYPDIDIINHSLADSLSLPLSAVFLEPHLTLHATNAADSPDQALRYTIWDCLAEKRPFAGKPRVILGEPGSGKTTLLRHTVRQIAQPAEEGLPPYLPIMLTLHQLATPIRSSPAWGLAEAIMGEIAKSDWQISPKWVRKRLKQGKFLVMLDGLDEIIDSNIRTMVYSWVKRQMAELAQNQFVLSTRPFAYHAAALDEATVLHLNAFSVNQIEHYIRGWFRATNQHSASGQSTRELVQSVQKQADAAIRTLHRRAALIEMATNPLLLRMMLDVHMRPASFSAHRIRLFERVCAVWLGGWRQARGVIEDLTAVQKKRILQNLAFHMTQEGQQKIPFHEAANVIAQPLREVDQQQPGEFLQMVVQASGLLVAESAGHYRFAHQTMQDYLTAVHVQQQRLDRLLLENVEDEWWHQTILFYAALTQDPIPVVRACLQKRPPSVQALTLMNLCLQEAPNNPEAQRYLRRLEISNLNQADDVRQTQAEVVKTLHLQEMVRLGANAEVGFFLVPQAMYQLFIEARQASGQFLQPDHWAAPQYPPGQHKQPILGVRAQDAVDFCRWLNQTEAGDWLYRLPTLREAKEMLLQSGFWQRKKLGTRGFWASSATRTRLILEMNDQNHWLAEANFSDELDFDLRNLTVQPNERALLEQLLLAGAKGHAYALSPMSYLFQPVANNVRAEIGKAFDRNLFGILRSFEAYIDHVEQAVGKTQRSKKWQSYEADLRLHAQRLERAMQLFRGTPGLQERHYLLLQRLEKLIENLRLRPSFLDQLLQRRLNETKEQVQKLDFLLRQAKQHAQQRLRQHMLLTLQTLYQQVGEAVLTSPKVISPKQQELNRFCQALYTDLLLLKGRRSSQATKQQPPLEGIRLVRDRSTRSL